MSEIFLPSRDYLYDDEVDKFVSDMDKNPSIFIPYLAKLRQYDAKPHYKVKLDAAIKKVGSDSKPAESYGIDKILPEKKYLYSDEVDLLVSEIDKNPSAFIPYLDRLHQYDTGGGYSKKKLDAAIKKVESADSKPAADRPSKPAALDTLTASEEEFPIEWFKNLRPYSEPEENPSHWKTISNHVKLLKLVPLFKSEETILNIALLGMKEVTNVKDAMRLLEIHPGNIRFINPKIYTEEMIQIVLRDPQYAIFIDKSSPLIKAMLPQFFAVPKIFDYIVLDEFLTERNLYELGFRQYFHLEDINPGRVLYLHALCHGELIGPMITRQQITRYSSVPLGVCEMLSSLKMSLIQRTTEYSNFVDNNIAHMKELIDRTHYSEDNPRYVAVKKLSGVVPKKTFLGTRIMNKVFSSLDVSPWHLNFLDIVTPTGKYNLFSIKPEWTLEEIVDLFPGKEIVLCDYSCSKNEGKFTTELLESTGGKRTKRTKRTKRRRTKRKF